MNSYWIGSCRIRTTVRGFWKFIGHECSSLQMFARMLFRWDWELRSPLPLLTWISNFLQHLHNWHCCWMHSPPLSNNRFFTLYFLVLKTILFLLSFVFVGHNQMNLTSATLGGQSRGRGRGCPVPHVIAEFCMFWLGGSVHFPLSSHRHL